MATPENLYDALGVNRGAPPDVIHKAYRRAARAAHPDMGGSAERWALISLARDTLTNPRKRQQYDSTGETDDLEAAAKQTVYDAVLQVASQAARMGDLTTFDIVKDAIHLLRQNLTNIATAKANLRAGDQAVAKVIERFKAVDGKPNMLHSLLSAEFQGAQRAAMQFEQQAKVTERAIAILREHRFEYTERGGMW